MFLTSLNLKEAANVFFYIYGKLEKVLNSYCKHLFYMIRYIPMNRGGHMKVLKGYVFRLYPNVEQKILINKTIGSARLIYNIFLRDKIDTYNNTKKGKSAYDQNNMIPSLLVKYPFLKEIDSCE